jgi:hypothetical protein
MFAFVFEYFFQWTSLSILSIYHPSAVTWYYTGTGVCSILFQAIRALLLLFGLPDEGQVKYFFLTQTGDSGFWVSEFSGGLWGSLALLVFKR